MDLLQAFLLFGIARTLGKQDAAITCNNREQVVEVMGHSAGQQAHGFHLL